MHLRESSLDVVAERTETERNLVLDQSIEAMEPLAHLTSANDVLTLLSTLPALQIATGKSGTVFE
jgi:hypothetical protein